jgi:EAL domain-containing protein (putative c-di-GMP-specific phosphodiesterase class I)
LVKIDGNLSKDVVNNERSRDIVKVMAGLTNRFGIDILAEYVEDKKQKDILEKIGCYEYQGYYFSQAVNLNELDNVIENVSNAVY